MVKIKHPRRLKAIHYIVGSFNKLVHHLTSWLPSIQTFSLWTPRRFVPTPSSVSTVCHPNTTQRAESRNRDKAEIIEQTKQAEVCSGNRLYTPKDMGYNQSRKLLARNMVPPSGPRHHKHQLHPPSAFNRWYILKTLM
jgi:hypothetical protein